MKLKNKLLTQKNRLKRRFFKERWSECRDSNPGPPAPKAGALPTAQHPVMKLGDPVGRILPNQARYQLRYTRIFNFCHYTTAEGKIKDFSACGHSCGQRRFCAAFCNRGKSRKRRRRKALRRFASPYPGYNHGTPKAGALPTALHPVIEFFIRLAVFSQSRRAASCAAIRYSSGLLRRFDASDRALRCKALLLYRLRRAVARIIYGVRSVFLRLRYARPS